MVAFVNRLTGSVMYVHESRAAEYEALGHVRADTLRQPSAVSPKGKGKAGAAEKGGGRKKAAAKE